MFFIVSLYGRRSQLPDNVSNLARKNPHIKSVINPTACQLRSRSTATLPWRRYCPEISVRTAGPSTASASIASQRSEHGCEHGVDPSNEPRWLLLPIKRVHRKALSQPRPLIRMDGRLRTTKLKSPQLISGPALSARTQSPVR